MLSGAEKIRAEKNLGREECAEAIFPPFAGRLTVKG
jgi:hypothetical protein